MENEALEQLELNRAQARRSEADAIAEIEVSIENSARFCSTKQIELNEANKRHVDLVGRRAQLLQQSQNNERLHAKTVRDRTPPEPVGPKIHVPGIAEEPKILCPACESHLIVAIPGGKKCNACGAQFNPKNRNRITHAGSIPVSA